MPNIHIHDTSEMLHLCILSSQYGAADARQAILSTRVPAIRSWMVLWSALNMNSESMMK